MTFEAQMPTFGNARPQLTVLAMRDHARRYLSRAVHFIPPVFLRRGGSQRSELCQVGRYGSVSRRMFRERCHR